MVGHPYHALEMILDLIWGPLEHVAKVGESDLVVRSDRRLETYGFCLEMDFSFCPYPTSDSDGLLYFGTLFLISWSMSGPLYDSTFLDIFTLSS